MHLIRSLSHDIRTPLTSLLSYSEFMKQKEALTSEEMHTYMELVEQKSNQIKVLTDQLLDGGSRHLEMVENGRFLMEQLADEFAMQLEDEFVLDISTEECPQFQGEFDIQELRRIFDNLVSNVRKYANEAAPVVLQIAKMEGRIGIRQSNRCKQVATPVESTKIGIDSIRKIAGAYGGTVDVALDENDFSIMITLAKIE